MVERNTTLNAVIYLASLASDYHQIDDLLDRVRSVTALSDASKDPSPQQEAQLVAVRGEIEAYLINGEQMRDFSKEALDQKVHEHFERSNGWLRWRLAGVVAIILAITALTSALVPVSSPTTTKGMLTVCTLNSLLSLAAALLFFRSLGSFVQGVRTAFRNIGLGFVLVALSQIVLPVPVLLFAPDSTGFQAIGIFISVVI